MAQAKVLKGVQLLIKIGDGASSEVFAHPCLINTDRGISFSAETNDTIIPDCSDPELIAWMGREKVSLSCQITGSGTLNTPDTEDFYDWLASADAKNVRAELAGVSAINGGGYFGGAFHLTQFELTGRRGSKVECSMTLVSDGEVTFTAAS